jgi:iron complex outermembrane receptor protein
VGSGGGILAQDTAPATAPQQAAAQPAATPTPPVAEEIVVTGSYIKGTPEDAALPVDVTDLDDMRNVGAPTVAELVRNLSYTSGNLAETNQFQPGGQGNIGVQTINVRGLGSARTLVLFNGRRHAADDTYGVDVTAIPKSVIGRVETLKDGAAALYGSDAIGGVVNFITREGFQGVELSGSEQFIDGSDGDHTAGLLTGWAGERMNFLAAFEWSHRSVLSTRDRDWALKPFAKNPEGGFTAIANPATIVNLPSGAATVDPECQSLGNEIAAGQCRFQYTYFDNLVENQDMYNVYGEFNFDITDNHKFHAEYLYAFSNADYKSSPSFAPQSNTGPDRQIYLVPPATNPNIPIHPGFAAMQAQYGALAFPAGTTSAFVINRSAGVTGCLGGPRCDHKGEGVDFNSDAVQTRVAIGLTGSIIENLDYNVSYAYSSRDRNQNASDMFVERMAFALDGLGGPDCNQSTAAPGSPGCHFYNPFSNSIQHSVVNGADNPNFNPAVANDKEMMDWLYGPQKFTTYNQLQVIDGVLSSELPFWELPGGAIGWAAGFQVRLERYDLDVSDPTNIKKSPCPFTNPRNLPYDPITNPLGLGNVSQAAWDACNNRTSGVTGPYAFLANFTEEHVRRTVYAFFGEISIPILDNLDAQIAVRYEDYGGSVGSTTDPKLAIRYSPLEWLTLRGSVSTTFRAPPESFLGGRGTGLEFVAPAGSFKAVDTFGNPDLKPEEALATNVGFVLETGGFYGSLDWWRLDFKDPFQIESQGQISTAYTTIGGAAPTGRVAGCQTTNANGTANLGWGMDTALNPLADPTRCNAIRQHLTFAVLPAGTTDAASQIQRVDVNYLNGSDILTQGLDFYLEYNIDDVLGGVMTVGGTGTYTIEYTSDDFLDINGALILPGGDFNNKLNKNTAPFTPKPDFKAETFIRYNHGMHNAMLVGRYVTGYKDAIPSLANLGRIDSFFTIDAHYNLSLFDDSTVLSFSVMNLADKDPPFTSTNLNYDPFTHDARGRMYKLGLTYAWKPD